MTAHRIDSFVGWHRQERGVYYAFTPISPELEDTYRVECWTLIRYGLPEADDDEWWDPGWYLFGPATWGEFMARTLPTAQDVGRDYIASRRPFSDESGGA